MARLGAAGRADGRYRRRLLRAADPRLDRRRPGRAARGALRARARRSRRPRATSSAPLLVDNMISTQTLVVRRDRFHALGGFDARLRRLSRTGTSRSAWPSRADRLRRRAAGAPALLAELDHPRRRRQARRAHPPRREATAPPSPATRRCSPGSTATSPTALWRAPRPGRGPRPGSAGRCAPTPASPRSLAPGAAHGARAGTAGPRPALRRERPPAPPAARRNRRSSSPAPPRAGSSAAQSSSALARLMSGRRCIGSFSGSGRRTISEPRAGQLQHLLGELPGW